MAARCPCARTLPLCFDADNEDSEQGTPPTQVVELVGMLAPQVGRRASRSRAPGGAGLPHRLAGSLPLPLAQPLQGYSLLCVPSAPYCTLSNPCATCWQGLEELLLRGLPATPPRGVLPRPGALVGLHSLQVAAF